MYPILIPSSKVEWMQWGVEAVGRYVRTYCALLSAPDRDPERVRVTKGPRRPKAPEGGDLGNAR